ncbi:hypothetical protein Tco_1412824 [Tanacetum coccineum]
MTSMKYRDKHNQVGFLKKPEESARFAEIVDFLKVSHISKLQLADALRISMLPNTEIFKGLGNMGYPTDGQADQAGTQSQTISPQLPPPPTIQHAPTDPPLFHRQLNLQKDESKVFETPKQGKSLGETYISPQGLEAAETLAEVLSQIKTKRRNVKTGVRRRLDAEDVSTGYEDVSTGFTDIKSASKKVSSGGEHVSASQREGNVVLEETPQTKRTKK